MQAKKQLRKPENWQDFETLCKKLWGEIWNCPEIKKNGRLGQAQNGVDVYGIPQGENAYYGIQCKGKDDYTNSNLTENELEEEINRALNFTPKLKKFYFATTANKDAKIEAFIREKNIWSLNNGTFEIHLFSWEDIVDLIDENKKTHDWYVKNQNFKIDYQIDFQFSNGEYELSEIVFFINKKTIYKKDFEFSIDLLGKAYKSAFSELTRPFSPSLIFGKYDKSLCRFNLRLVNKGQESIEQYKIFLKFEGMYKDIGVCSKGFARSVNENYDSFIDEETNQGKIIPIKNILVPDDFVTFDTMYIKPFFEESNVSIFWKLVSKNFKDEGELKLNLKPEFKQVEEVKIIDINEEERIEETKEDWLED